MLRFLLSSSREWLDQTFESPEVRATMAAWGMHLDFAPDVPGGAIFPYLESMAGQAFGMVLGKGGADTMIKAMEALITSAGGVIRTNADVASISISGNRATGVVLASGEQVTASKVVIAGVTPSALLGLLGGSSGDAGFDQAMSKFRHAPGTLMVHLATKDLPNWRASEELRRFAYVHIAPSLDQMARVYQQAVAGIMPAEPVLVVGQTTAIDPAGLPMAITSFGSRCACFRRSSKATRPAPSICATGVWPRKPTRTASLPSLKSTHLGLRKR